MPRKEKKKRVGKRVPLPKRGMSTLYAWKDGSGGVLDALYRFSQNKPRSYHVKCHSCYQPTKKTAFANGIAPSCYNIGSIIPRVPNHNEVLVMNITWRIETKASFNKDKKKQ